MKVRDDPKIVCANIEGGATIFAGKVAALEVGVVGVSFAWTFSDTTVGSARSRTGYLLACCVAGRCSEDCLGKDFFLRGSVSSLALTFSFPLEVRVSRSATEFGVCCKES